MGNEESHPRSKTTNINSNKAPPTPKKKVSKNSNECDLHNQEIQYYCTINTCKILMCDECFKEHKKTHKKKEEISETLRGKEYNFQFISFLGRGGCGTVFSVLQDFANIALKVIDVFGDVEESITEQQKQMFIEEYLKEANIHKSLRQQYIIEYYDHFYLPSEEKLVIKMELGDSNLSARLDNIEYHQALIWMAQITSGISYLHNKKIIHRDLKPGNILIKSENVKICDFGGAKLIEKTRMSNSKSSKNIFLGTKEYLAPEIFNTEQKKFTTNTDIWALGIIFFKMLNQGQHPFLYGEDFNRDDKIDKMQKKLDNYKQNPGEFKKKASKIDCGDILIGCLEYDPQRRIEIKKLMELIQDKLIEENLDITKSWIDQKKKPHRSQTEQYDPVTSKLNNMTKKTNIYDELSSGSQSKPSVVKNSKAEASNERANKLYLDSRFQEALLEYENAVFLDPSTAKYYFNKAGCLLRLQRFDEALLSIEKCLKLDKTYVKAYGRKGKIYVAMNNPHSAKAAFKEGLSLDIGNIECKEGLNLAEADLLQQKSEEYYIEGRFKEAIRELDQAIKLNQGKGIYHVLKAKNLLKLKQYETALDSAKNALVIDPENSQDSFEIQGNCLEKLNRVNEAINMYNKALEKNPNNSNVKKALSQLKSSNSTDNLFEQCEKYRAEKNYFAALSCIDQALKSEPQNMKYLFKKAQIQDEKNDKKEALLTLLQILEKDRAQPEALLLVGKIFIDLKEIQLACNCFQEGLKVHPLHQGLLLSLSLVKDLLEKAVLLNREGVELFHQDRFMLALKKFDEAIEINNKDPNFHNNRANALFKLGDIDGALQANAKCLEIDKSFILGYTLRGAIYLSTNNKAKAEKAFRDGLEIDPTNEECKNGLRNINGGQKNINDLMGLLVLKSLLENSRPQTQDPLFFLNRNSMNNSFNIFDLLNNND